MNILQSLRISKFYNKPKKFCHLRLTLFHIAQPVKLFPDGMIVASDCMHLATSSRPHKYFEMDEILGNKILLTCLLDQHP